MVNVLRAITTSSSPVKVSITLTKGEVALFMFLSQKITRSPTVKFFQSVVHCCLPFYPEQASKSWNFISK